MTEVAEQPAIQTKTVSQSSGLWDNLKVNNVPATVADWVSLLGEEKVCEKLQQTVMVHSHLVQFRTKACKYLSENSGYARESKVDDKGKVTYPKSEGRYITALGDFLEENDRSPEEFREALQGIMDEIDFVQSCQTRVRGTGETAPAKKYISYAEALRDEGKIEEFAEIHNLPTDGLDDDEVITVVARQIRKILLEQQRKAEEQALATLKSL
jgi:hypothetical protein